MGPRGTPGSDQLQKSRGGRWNAYRTGKAATRQWRNKMKALTAECKICRVVPYCALNGTIANISPEAGLAYSISRAPARDASVANSRKSSTQ